MSRFHDQTTAWFNQADDAEALGATPGALPERRRVSRFAITLAVTLTAAAIALAIVHRVSRAAPQSRATPAPQNSSPVAAPQNNSPVAAPQNNSPVAAPQNNSPVAAPQKHSPVAAPQNNSRSAAAPARGPSPADELRRFEARLAQSPNDEAALRGACIANLQLGKVSDAARLCRHALRVDPTDVTARRALAHSYMLGGACRWSLNEWRQILADRPGDPEARRELHARRAHCDSRM
jgi:hypothetical protein